MEGGLGPALGFGSLSRNGSASLVKVGSQGPRTGPPHESGDTESESGLRELGPGRESDLAGRSRESVRLLVAFSRQP